MFAFLTYIVSAVVKAKRVFRITHWLAWFFNLIALVFFISCLCVYANFIKKLNRPRLEFEYQMSETNFAFKNGTYAARGFYDWQFSHPMPWHPALAIQVHFPARASLHT